MLLYEFAGKLFQKNCVIKIEKKKERKKKGKDRSYEKISRINDVRVDVRFLLGSDLVGNKSET